MLVKCVCERRSCHWLTNTEVCGLAVGTERVSRKADYLCIGGGCRYDVGAAGA